MSLSRREFLGAAAVCAAGGAGLGVGVHALQATPKPQNASLSATIVDPGSTICEADIDVEFTVNQQGAGATLTLTATAMGCTPVVTNSVRAIDPMVGSGVETFAVDASSCVNGTSVTLTATITQGGSSATDSVNVTVNCA